MLYYPKILYKVVVFNKFSFFCEHVGIVCVILCELFLAIMEEYIIDQDSRMNSQGKWSQNSQWMQDMIPLIFKINQSLISQILHGLNLLFSLSSKFHPPPIIHMFDFFCKEDNWRSLLNLAYSKEWNNNNNNFNMFLKRRQGKQQKRKPRRRRKPRRMSQRSVN